MKIKRNFHNIVVINFFVFLFYCFLKKKWEKILINVLYFLLGINIDFFWNNKFNDKWLYICISAYDVSQYFVRPLNKIYTLCNWVKDSISARTTSDLEFSDSTGLASILALIVRISRRAFVFAIGILNFRTGGGFVRMKTDERQRSSCDTITRSSFAKSMLQQRNQRLYRWSIRSNQEIVKVDWRADCVYLRGNCYDNHRCYFHALRSANYSSGL